MKKCINILIVSLLFLTSLMGVQDVFAESLKETENNDSRTTANLININTDYIGSISEKDDVDYYKFNITTGGYFQLQFKIDFSTGIPNFMDQYGFEKKGFYIEIYQGMEVIKKYEDVKKDFITMELPYGAGEYYVKVSGNEHHPFDTNYKYTINVKHTNSDAWETEPNDTLATADIIKTNKDYYGFIYDDDDVDYYKFNITENGYFLVKFSIIDTPHMDDGCDLTVYKNGDVLKTYEGIRSNFISSQLPFGKGEYLIKISNSRFSLSDVDYKYNLNIVQTIDSTWESEYNDTSSTANLISVNKVYNGSLYNTNDIDYYKFNVTQRGYFQIKFGFVDIGELKHCTIVIYQDGSEIKKYEGIESNFISDRFPFVQGEYYVKIINKCYSSSYEESKYNLSIIQVADPSWEIEYNNYPEGADLMEMKKIYKGTLFEYGDIDYYNFKVSSNGIYKLNFGIGDLVDFDYGITGWNIVICKGSNYIAEYYDVQRGFTSRDLPLTKGTYYIIVYAGNDGPINYQYNLKVSNVVKNIKNVKTSKISNKVYTGKAIKPNITVKYGNLTLQNGVNYTLSYKNNKNTGKATITIKGKGNFTGTKTINFYIVPKKVTISSVKPGKKQFTVKYKKVTGASGYQIAYSTSKSKGFKYITVNSKTASKVIKKLKSKKKYYVKVRAYKSVGKTKYYGSYSAIKSVKIK